MSSAKTLRTQINAINLSFMLFITLQTSDSKNEEIENFLTFIYIKKEKRNQHKTKKSGLPKPTNRIYDGHSRNKVNIAKRIGNWDHCLQLHFLKEINGCFHISEDCQHDLLYRLLRSKLFPYRQFVSSP